MFFRLQVQCPNPLPPTPGGVSPHLRAVFRPHWVFFPTKHNMQAEEKLLGKQRVVLLSWPTLCVHIFSTLLRNMSSQHRQFNDRQSDTV